jgi:hypothetical protein
MNFWQNFKYGTLLIGSFLLLFIGMLVVCFFTYTLSEFICNNYGFWYALPYMLISFIVIITDFCACLTQIIEIALNWDNKKPKKD